jgi:hypothetical protein
MVCPIVQRRGWSDPHFYKPRESINPGQIRVDDKTRQLKNPLAPTCFKWALTNPTHS